MPFMSWLYIAADREFPTAAFVTVKLPRLDCIYAISLFHSAAVIVLEPDVLGTSHAKSVFDEMCIVI